jgi:hypothetical protein
MDVSFLIAMSHLLQLLLSQIHFNILVVGVVFIIVNAHQLYPLGIGYLFGILFAFYVRSYLALQLLAVLVV